MCRLLKIHATWSCQFWYIEDHCNSQGTVCKDHEYLHKGSIHFFSSLVGGSFRQFLWQAAKEISGPLLRLLIPCNNSDRKGRYIFRPGPMSFSEERLLQFFGQVHWLKMSSISNGIHVLYIPVQLCTYNVILITIWFLKKEERNYEWFKLWIQQILSLSL